MDQMLPVAVDQADQGNRAPGQRCCCMGQGVEAGFRIGVENTQFGQQGQSLDLFEALLLQRVAGIRSVHCALSVQCFRPQQEGPSG